MVLDMILFILFKDNNFNLEKMIISQGLISLVNLLEEVVLDLLIKTTLYDYDYHIQLIPLILLSIYISIYIYDKI
jgi:hypothetical protein